MNRVTGKDGLSALLNRSAPSKWESFLKQPCIFLAGYLYRPGAIVRISSQPAIKVVCISDTHNSQLDVPDGEILIHAGDTTQGGTLKEFQAALDWLHSLPHRHKVLIAGNHELLLDPDTCHVSRFNGTKAQDDIDFYDIIYLNKSDVTLICSGGRQVKVYGSPMTPKHGSWAFQHPRSVDVWTDTIPEDTDILITHGAPLGHLDIDGWGCKYLLEAIWHVKPKLHVYGHLHDGYGTEQVYWTRQQRAFERLVVEKGGLINLLRLALAMLLGNFLTLITKKLTESQRIFDDEVVSTRLVNAAVAGGRFDRPVKKPIVVDI